MRRFLIAGTVLATLLAGGCGIPDNGEVTVVGSGPSSGISVGDSGATTVQNTREKSSDPGTFVNYYLQAAAGDPETALARVKAFMSPEAAAGFQPGNGSDIQVVRMVADPLINVGNPEITLIVQQVGTLDSNGVLTPPADPTPAQSKPKLVVGTIAGKDGLFVLDAPPMLMISDTALRDFYEPRTIYWWNLDYTGLVPDMRYMPQSVPTVQQPTTVLSWLANGPSDWLRDAVHGLAQNTAAPDNVPAIDNDTLQITLGAQAVKPGDSVGLDRLRRQLQWSLRPLVPRRLELTVGRQPPVTYTDEEYLDSNPAYGLADVPERFVVYNGMIRRLADSPHAADPVPVLKAAANKNITAAAMNSSETHISAAVLTGSGNTQRLRVASAPIGSEADLKEVRGLSGALGRPVWGVTPDGDTRASIGLITANGKLHSFRADGSPAQRVEWQGDPGPVTAVSVAPDGRRVVVVAGGRLYRTTLALGPDGISLTAPEQMLPPTLTTVSAAAWSNENYLAVAGVRADGRSSVMDVTIDSALALPNSGLADLGDQLVTYLTAYPANPVTRPGNLGLESYEASGAAWDVSGKAIEITAGSMAPPLPSSSARINPLAPFFLG